MSNLIRLYTDDDYKFNTSHTDADTYLHGCYFHGYAKEILGHDLICVPNDFVPTEGIHLFEVRDRTYNHQICTGKIYIWDIDDTGCNRGLAIATGDIDSELYAIKCYAEKEKYL
jgi:hypothetical protein